VETAAAQSDLNRQTATTQQLLNMVDQVTPYGTISYSQTGQTFVPDSTGDTWYVDPEGNYTQTAPGMVTTTTPGTTNATGDPGTHNIGFLGGSTTTPGTTTTSLPEGWTTATGYYVPRYTQTTTLSDEQQQILDASQAAQLNLANLASDQSSFLSDYLGQTFSYDPTEHSTWAMGLYDNLNGDTVSQQQNALRTQLANQGIQPGTAAYDAAMRNLTTSQGNQRNQFLLDSYNTGFNTALTERNQPINEITALLSGSQVANPAAAASATPSTSLAGVDYAGLVGDDYNAELSNSQAAMGGLFGLGGSLLGAAGKAGGFAALLSDRRAKTDILRIGTTDGGLPVYRYRYKSGGPMQIGVMAQDVREIQPWALRTHESGLLAVDYSEVF